MCKALLFSFLFCSAWGSSQVNTDTLNKFNSKHKKQGFWVVYLTDHLLPVKDAQKACYYAFNYFDNGVKVGFFPWAGKERKNAGRLSSEGQSKEGAPVLLNGNFKYYDKNGKKTLDEIYKNGTPLLMEAYTFDKSGICVLKETCDFTKMYNNQFGSFYYEQNYYVNNIIDHTWYGKSDKGIWRFINNKSTLISK
jgi:hypothetical protein